MLGEVLPRDLRRRPRRGLLFLLLLVLQRQWRRRSRGLGRRWRRPRRGLVAAAVVPRRLGVVVVALVRGHQDGPVVRAALHLLLHRARRREGAPEVGARAGVVLGHLLPVLAPLVPVLHRLFCFVCPNVGHAHELIIDRTRTHTLIRSAREREKKEEEETMVHRAASSVTYEAEVRGVGVDVSPGHLGLALLPDAAARLVVEGGGGGGCGRRALHLVVGRELRRRRRLAGVLVVVRGGVEAVAPDPLPGRRGRGAALRRGGLAVGGGHHHHVVDLALQLGVVGQQGPQHLAEALVLVADSPELSLERLHLHRSSQ
jgi:hypothetical protein